MREATSPALAPRSCRLDVTFLVVCDDADAQRRTNSFLQFAEHRVVHGHGSGGGGWGGRSHMGGIRSGRGALQRHSAHLLGHGENQRQLELRWARRHADGGANLCWSEYGGSSGGS